MKIDHRGISHQNMNRFYVTTPIYYVNDRPHIGHAYTTVLADVLSRYHRLLGEACFFLTGTDEHGQKVQAAAEKRGVDPQIHCDETCERFRELWVKLNISNDDFIRTTEARHKGFVQEKLSLLWQKGEIYAADYEGWYCVGCERFYTAKEVSDETCPEPGCSGRKLQFLQEKNYFFRMSKYQDWLIRTIEEKAGFIYPESRKNEVLGFLRAPLADLCISRPKRRLAWGIELPFDADYVTYVWFDALLNYMSAVSKKPGIWPASVHLIGKDILITHAVYWPTMLKAMGEPLPETILAHGWWLSKSSKMSKSVGNVINPLDMLNRYGPDTLRYFLMREMVLGQDSDFSEELFVKRVDTDLANDLGNMLSRIVKFSLRHFSGDLKRSGVPVDKEEEALMEKTRALPAKVGAAVSGFRLEQGIEAVMENIRCINRFFDAKSPWHQTKKEPEQARLTIAWAAEALRICLRLLEPVMPTKMVEGLARLGSANGVASWSSDIAIRVSDGESLFPRIMNGGDKPAPTQVEQPKTVTAGLNILRAKIISAVPHPSADRLYHLQVDDGTRVRSVCAGLRAHYSAEELGGRRVALLANLKPANLRGILSEGMLLAASGAEKLEMVDPGDGPLGEAFGESPEPVGEITLKDFQAHALSTVGGEVICDGKLLKSASGQTLRSRLADGAPVR